MKTLTVIVPAHNEEHGLPATLRSMAAQTVPPEKVIVVDDGSTDRTSEVAAAHGVTVLRPPHNLGSKAKAQNYALPHCDTDLVLAVDADTVLAPDYIERIKPAFDDPEVGVAAGNVQARFTRTPWERGRSTEYLFGFHWHRPIQQLANSPLVCSGCCSVFRRASLTAFGGFPERTIVEDMDFTWSRQLEGRRAVYVSDAMAWAADPETLTYFRKQVWRWMAGFMQNVRLHLPRLLTGKPMLATWIVVALLEILLAPLWWATPLILTLGLHEPVARTMAWWAGSELLLTTPALLYAARRRRLPLRQVLFNLPFVYLNKAVNLYYAWKAMTVELIMVPLGLSPGLLVYEKGR
ncbi:cellulose synthase/poly-beta-1,6-N-acetylglucosamine synthase-like glycosyltransferase [Nonomuraea polychroma]|uniref:Cellulose synthase/poly-beta-1,6-N-acetylglucosamine synthase-like glycosyltransferase n=1 Tax=Nonomuraea polychroma TaxID=46176 RepID=A0A438MD26_9ACTN|nr:glycosyltransferase family 2 protein [Nonomuraea polychroma]RVX43548.1 cellulose synthase/poly-beta-1,6-N-acetylglucosamine synthase-like glycosyltransferase [Nonomuraea polychroma]